MKRVETLRAAGAMASSMANDPGLDLATFDRDSQDLSGLLMRGGRESSELNAMRHAAGLLEAIRRRDRSTLWSHGFRQSTPEGATRAVLQTVAHLADSASRKPLKVVV